MQARVQLLFLLWIVGTVQGQTGGPTEPTGPTLAVVIGCPSQVDGVVCFASTDCRGGVVESDAVASGGDCCANLGLSFCDERGCRNCFLEEAFTGPGSLFHLGFFSNLRFQPRLSLANLRVQVSSEDTEPATVRVSYQDTEETEEVAPGESVTFFVDRDLRVGNIQERDKAVVVESVGGQGVSVVAFSEEITSGDSYCILPCIFLPSLYEYYAVSVPRTQLMELVDGELEPVGARERSAFLIVSSEDSTMINLTLTQTVDTAGAADLQQFGSSIRQGETVSLTLDRAKTLYVSSLEDLTGSRVVSNKPLTFLSGHECGTIPQTLQFCDQMVEEIPPTSTWGKRFHTAPFLTREGVDAFKVLAAQDNTILRGVCSQPVQGTDRTFNIVIDRAGGSRDFNVSSDEFCMFESDGPVLLIQLSIASRFDNVTNADPFMVLIPPEEQYKDRYVFKVFPSRTALDESHYINVILPSEYSRSDLLLNGVPVSEDEWVPIPCVADTETVCSYAAQLEISTDTQTVTHRNPDAQFSVIIYSLGFRLGQGYSAGMTQQPIALDQVSLSSDSYEVSEAAERVTVFLMRTGDTSRSTTVQLNTRSLPGENAAQVGEDYIEVSETVTFLPQQNNISVVIPLAADDVLPEEDKDFEVYLGPSLGVYIAPFAYATVSIINDDPDLPVMEVNFAEAFMTVREGAGLLDIMLVKVGEAVGPVSVRLTTQDGTATGVDDYVPFETVVTFAVDETERIEQIQIRDNSFLEDSEVFTVSLEAIVNLDEGNFPVVTPNDTATVRIEDNDVAVIGFSPIVCEVSEGDVEFGVNVAILYGSLDTNITVFFQTESGTALGGQDFTAVSRNLLFTRSQTRYFVSVLITDDSELEDRETFSLRLGLEESAPQGVELIPQGLTISIADDDSARIGLEVNTTVQEGDVVMVTVRALEGNINSEVVVGVSAVSGTATAGDDFEAIMNRQLTFNPETQTQTFSILTFDNDEFEGDKTFSVLLGILSASRQVRVEPSLVVVTIEEDDEMMEVIVDCYLNSQCGDDQFFSQTLSDCCVALQGTSFTFSGDESGVCQTCIVIGFNQTEFLRLESNTAYLLRVSVLRGFLPQDISLQVTPVSGSATPADYSVSPTVSLTRRRPFGFISVFLPREDNSTDQDFESFRLELSDPFDVLPSNIFFQNTVVTIENYQLIIGFEQTAYTAEEGVRVEVGVVVNFAPDEDLLIVVDISEDSTADADDFSGSVFGTYTIPAGSRRLALQINITDDPILEGDEQFTLVLTGSSAGIIDPDTALAEVTITDNDRVLLEYRTFDGVEGGVATVQLFRFSPASIPISATVDTTGGGTATPNVDYTASEQTVVISPQQTSVNVTVPLLEDNIAEAVERASVFVFSTTPGVISPDFLLSFGIQDNDVARVIFEEMSYTVSEDAGSVVVVVTLDPETPLDPDLEIPVELVAVEGTARLRIDFSEPETTFFVLSASSPSANASFTIRDNRVTEGNRMFTVEARETEEGGNPPQLVEYPETSATVTIEDDDIIVVGFIGNATRDVRESIGSFNVEVGIISGILGQTDSDIVVDISAVDGSAQSGLDYLVDPVTLFAILGGTVNVTIIPDDILEEMEDLFLVMEVRPTDLNVVVDPDLFEIFINDDDGALIGFESTAYTVGENDSFALLTVEVLEGTLELSVLIEFATFDRDATGPSDYIPTTTTLTFDAETTRQSVAVTIIDDDEMEEQEAFGATISLLSDVDVSLGPPFSSVFIEDNDQPDVVVGFLSSSYNVSEAGEVVDLEVGVLSGTVERSVAVEIRAISGTAMVGTDVFPPEVTTYSFFPEEAPLTLFFDVAADNTYENTESFTVQIVSTSVGIIDPELGQTTVNIFDTDTLSFGGIVLIVDENEGTGRAALRKFDSSEVPVELTVRTGEGTATPFEDYIPIEQSLVFEPDEITKEILVTIINDTIVEPFEQISIEVTTTLPRVNTGEPFSLFIRDDDSAVIGFQPDTYSVSEDDGSVELTVRVLSGTLGGEVLVGLRTFNDSALGFLDFNPTATTFTFDAEITEQDIIVTIIDDEVSEDREFFTAELFIISEEFDVMLSPETANISIGDNDQPRFGFLSSSYNVSENENVELEIGLLSGTLDRSASVEIGAVSGTAMVGADVFPSEVTLYTFFPEEAPLTVFFNVVVDETYENTESFTVQIVSTSAGIIDPELGQTTVNILDIDSIFFGFDGGSATEDEGSILLLLSIFGASEVPVEITVRTVDRLGEGVATPFEDYLPIEQTIVFQPNETMKEIFVTIINDTIVEPEEMILLEINSTMPRVTDRSFSLSIEDDDSAVIGFQPDTYSVSEDDGSVELTVRVLSGTLGGEVLVGLLTFNDSALGFLDFTPTTTTLTFSAEITEQVVNITIIDDGVSEDVEFFTAGLFLESEEFDVTMNPRTANISIEDPVTTMVFCFSSSNCSGSDTLMTVEECCGESVPYIANSYMRDLQCVPCSVGTSGNKFWIGFMRNTGVRDLIFDDEDSLQITLSLGEISDDSFSQNPSVTVTRPGDRNPQTVSVPRNSTVTVNLDISLRLQSSSERDKGILIEAETGVVSVVGTNIQGQSRDSFAAIPCTLLPTDVYEFYAVSPSANLNEISMNSFLIVACESETTVTVTPTQTITDPNNMQQRIEAGESAEVLLSEGQTLYIRSLGDLTGSRIVTNKPVSFYSGHERGTTSRRSEYESHLVEQLPPTAVWGTYLVAVSPPDVFSESVYRVLTAASMSTIEVSCQMSPSFTTNIARGEFAEFTAMRGDVCTVFSTNNDPLLLVQFTEPGGMLNVFEVHLSRQLTILPPGSIYATFYFIEDEPPLAGREWTGVPCYNGTQLNCVYYVQVQPNDNISGRDIIYLASVYTLDGQAGTAYTTGFELYRNHNPLLSTPEIDITLFEGTSQEVTVVRYPPFLTLAFTVTAELISATEDDFDISPMEAQFDRGIDNITITITAVADDIFEEEDEMFRVLLVSDVALVDDPLRVTIIRDTI